MIDWIKFPSIKPSQTRLVVVAILLFIIGIVLTVASTRRGLASEADNVFWIPAVIGKPAFEAQPSIPNFSRVTSIANAGDDRLFVAERPGVIYVVQPSGAKSLFLDLQQEVVDDGREGGFLDMVFHPNYQENGYFYVTYTTQYRGDSFETVVLSRFQVSSDPNQANKDSQTDLLQVGQAFDIHNGGGMAFNPINGWLYIGFGDDSQNIIAQDSKSVKGKVVRLDVDAVGPSTQVTRRPFLDALTAVDTDIVAKGLRNPWRFDFDPIYGHLYIAEVGDLLYEEINVIPSGLENLNFGWPCIEGPKVHDVGGPCKNPARFAPPSYYYSHGSSACAIIGGVVFRHIETQEYGPRFIFGDMCSREILSLSDATGEWVATPLGQLPEGIDRVTTIDQDVNGSVYVGSLTKEFPVLKLLFP